MTNVKANAITWRLKKGGDRRVRQGHPWVFAGELAHSTRDARPGDLIELRDARENFVTHGYGHPTSAICFRKLSSREKETDVLSVDFFRRRLAAARELRRSTGWTKFSHRWLFAEADGVPGLIVDAFLIGTNWVIVAQASTAGIDRALPAVFEAIASFATEFTRDLAGPGASASADADLTIIDAPSSRARLAEGLELGPKRVVRTGAAIDLANARLTLAHDLTLSADLLTGQKTGFFLDQQWNAGVMRELLTRQFAVEESNANAGAEPLRILDVCCYVGQWSAHAVRALKDLGHPVEVTLVDVSRAALDLARANVGPDGAGADAVHVIEGDALRALDELTGPYDVVICDPPAFVKKKTDLEPGLRAYVKLNRDALKLTRPGGLFVASSCSGLVKTGEYQRVMAEASTKAGRTFKQIATGGHGPDHPIRPDFPEGEYLKCFFGRVEYPY